MRTNGDPELGRPPERLDYAHALMTPEAEHYDVLLDGHPLELCIEASVSEGWAKAYLLDDNDQVKIGDDGPEVETYCGHVEIVRRPSE